MAKRKTVAQQVEAYRRLKNHLGNYCNVIILDFDEISAAIFQQMRDSRVRVGTQDLKIAAIALATDALLLSRNLRDFRRISGLRVEDWTL